MRADLPTGTVTFLFTDIEGSTVLLRRLGAEAYAAALAEHRRLLRAAFRQYSGVEVDTQGDAFFFAFPTAPGALSAARQGQQALAGGPIRVRMGIHTGTPYLAAEGYVGADVHRAARIAGVAHGGQVLLSSSTAALVEPQGLRDLGEHRLKDLSAPERIYQVGETEFPPLRSLYRTNLPVPATAFLGRERQLAEVAALLESPGVRLVTLTGAGGSGKTRLALQAAARSSDDYPDGVYWVPLATVRDPGLVLPTAAATLGAGGDLAAHIGAQRMLVLFDNFEQVVDAAGGVADLLARCPRLSVLVTSREPLHLTGEQEYPVLPLAQEEAVPFFLTRARAVVPGFPADPAVGEICRRLDDLPLALELAAARVKALTAQQLLDRLAARLPLLTGGARDQPERQRTLRATIAWSYDLLTAEEQRTLCSLAVFTGGCTLSAAEDVTGADLDTLQSLLDKSLLRRTGERLWMLETIREFALDQLREAGEEADAAHRHAEYYLSLAASASLTAEELGSGGHYELVIPEADNLRGAIDWALAAGDYELAGAITVALEQFWVASSPYEGARRVEQILQREEELSPLLRARALRVAGGACAIVGEFDRGRRWHEEALAAFRDLGDDRAAAHLLFRLAIEAYRVGDPTRALALLEESEDASPSHADQAQRLGLLGNLAFAEGRVDDALDLLAQSAELAEKIGFRWWQLYQLLNYADIALRAHRPDTAVGPAAEGLRLARTINDRQSMVYGLALMALLAGHRGDYETGGRLWGALEAETQRSPVGQWEQEREGYASRLPMGDPAFEHGRAEGQQVTLEQAVDQVIEPLEIRQD